MAKASIPFQCLCNEVAPVRESEIDYSVTMSAALLLKGCHASLLTVKFANLIQRRQ